MTPGSNQSVTVPYGTDADEEQESDTESGRKRRSPSPRRQLPCRSCRPGSARRWRGTRPDWRMRGRSPCRRAWAVDAADRRAPGCRHCPDGGRPATGAPGRRTRPFVSRRGGSRSRASGTTGDGDGDRQKQAGSGDHRFVLVAPRSLRSRHGRRRRMGPPRIRANAFGAAVAGVHGAKPAPPPRIGGHRARSKIGPLVPMGVPSGRGGARLHR